MDRKQSCDAFEISHVANLAVTKPQKDRSSWVWLYRWTPATAEFVTVNTRCRQFGVIPLTKE